MKELFFPEWSDALRLTQFSLRQKQSFEITLRWFLGFCRRARAGVTVQSARDFIDWATREKKPQPWQVEDWKEALNWFFREAKAHRLAEAAEDHRIEGVWLPPAQAQWPSWKGAFLTTLRRRHYSYRTEQSYLVWIERFARQAKTEELAKLGEAEIAAFLDGLALDQRLSASSQRQALHALVSSFAKCLAGNREIFRSIGAPRPGQICLFG